MTSSLPPTNQNLQKLVEAHLIKASLEFRNGFREYLLEFPQNKFTDIVVLYGFHEGALSLNTIALPEDKSLRVDIIRHHAYRLHACGLAMFYTGLLSDNQISDKPLTTIYCVEVSVWGHFKIETHPYLVEGQTVRFLDSVDVTPLGNPGSYISLLHNPALN